ncbi:FRG domain-containing protein [Burkholderia cenocepacia]|uniref:FRG domain-containing protein n=1 Tax=Burkholderia cenocepacia TaxID=95486 RepID=UPI0024B6AB6E|nr:FRG domain-containing protein [Burkholderia cenocepacia]MDI9694981.1 FRG domain-containing protein [Burkholderia cenocepacia]
MRHKERKIRTVADLLRGLRDHVPDGDIVWYRGQTRAQWGLTPSLARDGGIHLPKEGAIAKRFMQNATQLLVSPPADEWGWQWLMQHHRVPTRLLDWTESPLVALYFATSKNDDEDGAFWCLDPIALNRQANVKFAYELELPSFNDAALGNYLPSKIDPRAPMDPVAAVGPRSSKRMAAQIGAFTVNHAVYKPLELLGDEKHVWRYVIPKEDKDSLRKELIYLGFTSLTIFPDLDEVAALIKREFLE